MRPFLIAPFVALALGGCVIIESDKIAREIEREVTAEIVEDVAEPEAENPLDLRRTTLVVRDIEKSLAL